MKLASILKSHGLALSHIFALKNYGLTYFKFHDI
jgi:hypothetical protein